MPGNQRAPDGTLQNVGPGLAGLAGKVGAGLLFGPAGATIAGKVIGAGIDSGG